MELVQLLGVEPWNEIWIDFSSDHASLQTRFDPMMRYQLQFQANWIQFYIHWNAIGTCVTASDLCYEIKSHIVDTKVIGTACKLNIFNLLSWFSNVQWKHLELYSAKSGFSTETSESQKNCNSSRKDYLRSSFLVEYIKNINYICKREGKY